MIRTMRFNRDTGNFRYFLDDKEVSKEEWQENWHVKPPDFSKGECPTVKGDLDDFSHLNSGKGIWNPQVNGYCRNVEEIKTKGRALGLKPMG